MNKIEKIVAAGRIEKTLNAISSSFSEVIWEHLKHSTHQNFVRKIEQYTGLKLISDEEVGSIYYQCVGNLVYSPTYRDADNKIRNQFNKIKKNPVLLAEIRSDINNLISLVNSPTERSFIFIEACNIYKKCWAGAYVDYPLYSKKKNANCILSVLSTLNALFASIAGITNYSPCEFLDSVRDDGDKDVLCTGWFSVPSVIMGRETARKSLLPVPERKQEFMLDIIMNNPNGITDWSDDVEVMTGTTIKNVAGLSNSKQFTCIDYHVDLKVVGQSLIVLAVYKVDYNGFSPRKKGIKADSNTLSEIQALVNQLNINLDTSESIKISAYRKNTLAHIRKLSVSHDNSASQMKLSITKFGVTKPNKGSEKRIIH